MKLRHLPFAKVTLAAALAVTVLCAPAYAQEEYASDPFDAAIAREAWYLIGRTEKAYGVPPGLLHAMSLVETGQGIKGWLMPWPYTVCVNSPGSTTYTTTAKAQSDLTRLRSLGFVRFDATIAGKYHANLTKDQALAKLGAAQANAISTIKPRPFGRRFANGAEAESYVNRMFAQGYTNMDLGLMQINWRFHGKKLGSVRAAFDVNRNVAYAVNYLLEHRQTRDWWGSVGRYHSGTPRYANRYIGRVWSMYKRVHRLNQA